MLIQSRLERLVLHWQGQAYDPFRDDLYLQLKSIERTLEQWVVLDRKVSSSIIQLKSISYTTHGELVH